MNALLSLKQRGVCSIKESLSLFWFSLIDRTLDLRYYLLVKFRLPGIFDLLNNLWIQFDGRKIRLEASSVCQLKCPACSTANGVHKEGIVGSGHLKLKNFERLLDNNAGINQIEISNWGEIFLNPEIESIIRCAYLKKVRLTASNGVNLNTVKDEVLEALVKYRFQYLSVSLDGASQETYKQYRILGDFNKVIKNIQRINYFKAKYGSDFPQLTWQFIIFGHNEHELPRAREMAWELKMKFQPKLNHSPLISPVVNVSFVRREGGFKAISQDEFRAKKKKEYSFPCGQLWSNPQVNWDGTMLGCCVNKWGSFGNVFQEGLKPVMEGEKFTYAKLMVLGRKPPSKEIPCWNCNTYWRLNPQYNCEDAVLISV